MPDLKVGALFHKRQIFSNIIILQNKNIYIAGKAPLSVRFKYATQTIKGMDEVYNGR